MRVKPRRIVLMLIALLMLAGFVFVPLYLYSVNRQQRKTKFDAIPAGMALEDLDPEVGWEGCSLFVLIYGHVDANWSAKEQPFGSSGGILPNSSIILTFTQGRLTHKESRDPTIRDVLDYWLQAVKKKCGFNAPVSRQVGLRPAFSNVSNQ